MCGICPSIFCQVLEKKWYKDFFSGNSFQSGSAPKYCQITWEISLSPQEILGTDLTVCIDRLGRENEQEEGKT